MKKLYLKIVLGGTLVHLLSIGYASMNPDEGDRVPIKRELNDSNDLNASKRARIDTTFLTIKTDEGQTPQVLAPLPNTPLSAISTTREQGQSLSSEEEIQRSRHLVFSGEPLCKIASFLGREEVGRLQSVNKGINDFFQGQESFGLWKSYARQLQLEIQDHINFNELKRKIREYYTPYIKFLITKDDLMTKDGLRFKGASISCSNSNASVLVGLAKVQDYNKCTAVMWKNREIKSLGLLNNGPSSQATAISGDGKIIAGKACDDQNNIKWTAVMWENGEIKSLGFLNNGPSSQATAISGDGKIIAGMASDGQNNNKWRAVMWENGEIKSLGLLNNGRSSQATAISGDGKIIAGMAFDDQNKNKWTAVMWENGEIKSLGFLNNGPSSQATAVSGDGKIIAGKASDGQNNNKWRAVMWENGEIKSLGLLNNGRSSQATAISGDGKIIAGMAFDNEANRKERAVIWNEQGIVSLQDYKFKEDHDILAKMISVSSNGSDFVVESKNNIYKAHVPRHDLWKMYSPRL